MKKILTAIFLFFCCSSFAQPVLTAASSNMVIGDIFYHHQCDTAGVLLDAGGPAHTWNYGTLAVAKTDTVSVLSCSSTPYIDSFPGANIAIRFSPENIAYGLATKDFTTDIGNHSDQVGYSYLLRGDTMKYPISYPMNWNDTSLEVYDTTFASSHLFRQGEDIVDGYGTLILPSGTFTNVLRIHSVVYLTDSNYTGGSLSVYHYRTDGYAWYVPGFHFPLLSMEVDNDVVSGAIKDIFYVVYTTGPGLASLSSKEITIANIDVYPNPVNDILHIEGINGPISYRLSNMVGGVVTTGRLNPSGPKGGPTSPADAINVCNIASGLYMLELTDTATGMKETRKIIKQ